ncbi:hypothetical protein CEK29_21105 [Bordetella genomosp. 5]|uniref:hypothetical protein n=1 Tax=Bordetella genomosp. 5 TaxID=1395608 RepID=UPI000B9E8CB8|nr:hypothetical protein [Bordetella genomosp. 5]OZI33363.1 hypothetical protein CEK29_21105 [Bordetella genomosp. 5]
MRKSSPQPKKHQPSLQEAIELAKSEPSMFAAEQWKLMATINESAYLGLPSAMPERVQPSEHSSEGYDVRKRIT